MSDSIGYSEVNLRKIRSKNQPIKIIDFQDLSDGFEIKVLGSSLKRYLLTFITDNISCSCPDHQRRKTVCKHLYFIIGKIAESNSIFNSIEELDDFTNDMIMVLKENILDKINLKKLENPKKEILSIERDDHCAICYEDFTEIKNLKCHQCSHVFHEKCLKHWWELNFNHRFDCAMCRTKSFEPVMNNYDPWDEFKSST